MFAWAPFVFVRLLAFLAAGICSHWLFGQNLPAALFWFLVAAVFYLICSLWFGRRNNQRSGIFFGFLGLFTTFLFGLALVQERTDSFRENHLSHFKGSYTHYLGRIDNYLVTKPTAFKTELAVTHVYHNQKWVPVTANVQLTLPKNSLTAQFRYGQVLLVKGNPSKFKSPLNPGEFNYRKYQEQRNIYHQHFLTDRSFAVIGYKPSNQLLSLAFSIRQNLDNVLRRYLPGQQEYALAKALVLGIKDELDNEVIKAYSATGTMHVLAVSGLHVGLIYGLLELVFRSKGRPRKLQGLFSGISLSIIWLYALLTGFSASVLRAVVMFSFLSIGRLINRTNAPYNLLALSALCLLVYNTAFLLDVGFQLSYLAVLGIVYLQPKLQRMLEFERPLPQAIWTITSVSFAAQLFTFPLSLLYFHQFPVYFLLSNLFVIPVSTVVMWGGVGLVLIGWFEQLAYWVGLALNWLIGFMNQGIFLFEKLPLAQISGLHISALETLLIYLFLVFLFLLAETKQFRYMVVATLVLFVLSGLQIWETRQLNVRGRITVYALRKHSGIEIMGNNSGLFLADYGLLENQQAMAYSVIRNWGEQDAEFPEILPLTGSKNTRNMLLLPDGNKVVSRFGHTFLLLREPLLVYIPAGLQFDYIILQQNSKTELSALARIGAKAIILDSSNAYWYIRQKKKEAAELGLKIYVVAEQGAYVEHLALK